eukprot:s1233_g5.t1
MYSNAETLMEERRHGFVFPIPGGVVEQERSLVKESLIALNKLAGSKFNDASQLFHRPATVVQSAAVENTRSVVSEAGDCPADLCGRTALQDMMKSHPMYGEPSTLVGFSAEKLKILKSTVKPKPLQDLLPGQVLPLLNRWKTHIELTPGEIAKRRNDDAQFCPAKPYWDPLLKSCKSTRTKLFVDLWRVGVISFRTSVKSHVGLFFVRKKDPAYIRMVVDCRIANAHHRAPPVTRLGSGANFAGFDLSDSALERIQDSPQQHIGYGTEMDVADCFYQFSLPQCAKWFGINDPRPVREWRSAGISFERVFDEDLDQWVDVSAESTVYPVFNAMPMGWTWALFFANETVSHIAKMGASSCLEVREKLHVPQLWEGQSMISTYVDNVAIFGAKKEDVQSRMQQIDRAFARFDIPVTWTYSEPVEVVETVGVIVDFRRKVVRNKPSRLWKVFMAGREICRRSKVRSEIVEVWLGHATSVMRLCPCLLSVFTFIYRFVMVNRGKRVALWPSVRAEMMQATALIWFARAYLGGEFNNEVDMGDSSDFGYAMTCRSVPAPLVREAASVKERWRFIPLPEEVKSAVEFFGASCDEGADKSLVEEHLHSFVRSGVGIDTEYGQWLQEALAEGWAQAVKKALSNAEKIDRPISSQELDRQFESLTASPLASTAVQKRKEGEKSERPRKRPKRSVSVLTGEVKIPKDRVLQCSKVKPSTLVVYQKAVSGFLASKFSRRVDLSDHKQVDEGISRYIHALCADGETLTEASYVVFGWILLKSRWHMPDRQQLPISRQALKGWKSRFPGKSRTGVDLALWDLVAWGAVQLGYHLCAAAILIQGDCYLRPCETLMLTRRHIIKPQRKLCTWGLVVALEEDGVPAKNKEFDECVFADTAVRSDVNSVIHGLFRQRLNIDESVFSRLNARTYNQQISASAKHVGLQSLRLTAHMLRHSGASHDAYYNIRTLKEIQSRGRWKAVSSVQRYRKPGKMLLSQAHVSADIWKRADAARPKVIQSLSQFFA